MPAWGTLFISLLTAVVAAVVTTWLARWRFRSERWWEKKFAVYTSIIEALQQMSSAFNDEFAEQQRASPDEQPRPTQLEEKYKTADEKILSAIALGEFIISVEAVAELQRFRRRFWEKQDYLDYLINSMEAINDCLGHMRHIAREDLKGEIGSSFRQVGRILARTKRALLKK